MAMRNENEVRQRKEADKMRMRIQKQYGGGIA